MEFEEVKEIGPAEILEEALEHVDGADGCLAQGTCPKYANEECQGARCAGYDVPNPEDDLPDGEIDPEIDE